MSTLTNMKQLNNFKLKILVAALLLIAGFSIWLYATSVIQGYTQLLGSSTLTPEEVWKTDPMKVYTYLAHQANRG